MSIERQFLKSFFVGTGKRSVSFSLMLVLVGFFLCTVCTNCCLAEKKELALTIEVDISSSVNRSGGPIPLTLRLNYFGCKAGLAGKLRFRMVSQNGALVATYLFEDLFIPPGEQTYEFLIQPPSSAVWMDAYDFYPIFETQEGETFAYPEQLLRLPGASRRSMVITIGTLNNERLDVTQKEFGSELALEKRMPSLDSVRPNQKSIVTLSRSLSVQDFPNSALEHCVSDIVILTKGTFEKLSIRQGEALLAWTRAGGSVAIFLEEKVRLPAEKTDLLNEFLSAPKDDPLVYQLSDGTWQFAKGSTETLLLRRCSFGRVAVGVRQDSQLLSELYSPSDRQQLFSHLWKLRSDQTDLMMHSTDGNWSFDLARRSVVRDNINFSNINDPGLDQFLRRFRPTPTIYGNGLLAETLPVGMQMLPLWLIGLTLLLYIIAIGPLDYFLLGALGLRKLTWIFFPVVTVLFTVGAIVAANRTMQGKDEGGRVIIHDITSDGLIARENEIETVVPRSGGIRFVEAKQELLTPINPFRLGISPDYTAQYGPRPGETIEEAPPLFRGRFPSEAQLVEQVHKWSPRMTRKLRISTKPTPEPSRFDWTLPVNPEDRDSYLELTRRIQAAFGKNVHAMFLRPRPSPGAYDLHNFSEKIVLLGHGEIFQDPYYDESRLDLPGMNSPQRQRQDFLQDSTYSEQSGIYSVVSQLSPKCDDFLEDLPILDTSEKKAWVLLIAVQDGNVWNIYRQYIKGKQL